MIDIFSEYKGTWAVISTGIGKFIGRIIEEDDDEILLQPVFDFIPKLVQSRDGGLGREVLVLPHELCSTLESKLIVKQPITILKFDNLEEIDREQYEKAVRKGSEIAIQSKAIKSNIILADRLPNQKIV